MKNQTARTVAVLAILALGVLAFLVLVPEPAEAAKGNKGPWKLHSHGGDLFLINERDGRVWRQENDGFDDWTWLRFID